MKTKFLVSFLATALFAVSAQADLVVSEFNGVVQNPVSITTPIGGDAYFIAPGIGELVTPAFFLSSDMAGYTDSVLDNASESIGTDLVGSGIMSSDLLTTAGTSFTLTLSLAAAGGADIAPGGFTAGGIPLDTAAFFVGTSGGGDPVDFLDHVITSATVDALDAAGGSLIGGPADVSGFANFTAGPGGGWDGNFGVQFGAGSAGAGINSYVLVVSGTKPIPEPTSLALLSVLGLGMVMRRRR